MANIDEIRAHIRDTAKYNGMSYASIVQVAEEVESVEDKDERAKLRRDFKQEHALTSQVWARVAKRFPDYQNHKSGWIRAVAGMCQVSDSECEDLFEAHAEHLDEPGAYRLVLDDVNTLRDRAKEQRQPRKAKDAEYENTKLFADVRILCDLICNSKPETPIKGDIESIALDIGHYPQIMNAMRESEAEAVTGGA